jgi:MFS transporter, DHA1 family, multidrug resistance protein
VSDDPLVAQGLSPPERRRVALIVALGALSAFGPLCLDMYLPALPQLPADLSSTATSAQLTLSACIVGLGAGQLIVGPLSDRLGRRGPLLVGVAIFVVASVVCAIATSMTLLIAMRFVQGAAGAAGIVVGRAVIADLFTGRVAASYFSTLTAINGLSPIIAPLVGGQVLRVGTWRTVFWVLAGIGVVLLVLAALAVRESLPPERRTAGGLAGTVRALRTLLGDGRYRWTVLAGTSVTAAMFGYLSTSPFLLQEGYGLSEQWFSASFALNALGIVLVTEVGRLLLRRTTSRTLLTVGVVQGLAGALILLGAVLSRAALPVVLIALFVMVSAVGFALPHSAAIAMDLHRSIAGSASALFGLAQFVLGAVTAPLAGLGDRVRGTALGVTAVIATLLGLAALLAARRALARDDRRSSSPDPADAPVGQLARPGDTTSTDDH